MNSDTLKLNVVAIGDIAGWWVKFEAAIAAKSQALQLVGIGELALILDRHIGADMADAGMTRPAKMTLAEFVDLLPKVMIANNTQTASIVSAFERLNLLLMRIQGGNTGTAG